jgi:hypothetical protein
LYQSSTAVPFLRAHADFAARYRPLDAEDVFYNAEQRAFVDPSSHAHSHSQSHSRPSSADPTATGTGTGTLNGSAPGSVFEGSGRVHGIITQNVDSLHSRAGANFGCRWCIWKFLLQGYLLFYRYRFISTCIEEFRSRLYFC